MTRRNYLKRCYKDLPKDLRLSGNANSKAEQINGREEHHVPS